MERRSRLDEARTRLVRLVGRHRPEAPQPEEPEIKVYPARPDGAHAERARELMQRPEFARFRREE